MVPKPKEIGVTVFKELLLSVIGNNDFDKWINGIVLSIKERDVITQIWLPNLRPRQKQKVHELASQALQEHCPLLFESEAREGLCSGSTRGASVLNSSRLGWSFRAHPTAQTASPGVQLKPLRMGEKREQPAQPIGDVDEILMPGQGFSAAAGEDRGCCGDPSKGLRDGCALM